MEKHRGAKKRKKNRWLRAIFAIALIILCILIISPGVITKSVNAVSDVASQGFSAFSRNVTFAGGTFPKDSTDITVILDSGETAKLSQFEALASADFSGSTCYDEIISWAAANPQVKVTYDITMPNGARLSPDETVIDLSSANGDETMRAAEMFCYFKGLSKVELGTVSNEAGQLSAADVAALKEANPNVSFDYSCSIKGRTFGMDTTEVNLAELGRDGLEENLSLLALLPNIEKLELCTGEGGASPFTLADIDTIHAACPNASCNYSLELYGKTISLSDDHIDINHIPVEDNGEAVVQVLKYMPNCKYLDMDSCGVSNERMAEIRDQFPNVDVVWRVNFGDNYSVRTNVTKILASKPSVGGKLTDDNCRVLQYCTKVRYLDLGHNDELCDFSFVRNMPDLEIVVASMTGITDLSPFTSCPNLTWLELGNTVLTDLSPLAGCPKLRHMNIAASEGISDISPLYDIPMRRLWIGESDPVPAAQVEHMRELHPNIEINTTVPTGRADPEGSSWTSEGWKYFQQMLNQDWAYWAAYRMWPAQRPMGYWKVVFKAFGYNQADRAYSFSHNDPLFNEHPDGVQPVNVYIIDTAQLDEDFVDYTTDPSSPNYLQPDDINTPPGDIIWVGTY